jgi:hypothetical protein
LPDDGRPLAGELHLQITLPVNAPILRSKARRCLVNLANDYSVKDEKTHVTYRFYYILYWLPGTDYSALHASPFGSPCGRSPPLRGVVEPYCFLSAVRIVASEHLNSGGVARPFIKWLPGTRFPCEEPAGISDPQLFLVWLQDRQGENALAYRYFTHFLGIKGAGHGQILADAESPEPGACE